MPTEISGISAPARKEAVLLVSLLDFSEESSFDYYWEELDWFKDYDKQQFHIEYDRIMKKAQRLMSKRTSSLNIMSEVDGYKWLFDIDSQNIVYILLFEENISKKLLSKLIRRLRQKISQQKFAKEKYVGNKLKTSLEGYFTDFNKLLKKKSMTDFLSSSTFEMSTIILPIAEEPPFKAVIKEDKEEYLDLISEKKKEFRRGVMKSVLVLAIGFVLVLLLFENFLKRIFMDKGH